MTATTYDLVRTYGIITSVSTRPPIKGVSITEITLCKETGDALTTHTVEPGLIAAARWAQRAEDKVILIAAHVPSQDGDINGLCDILWVPDEPSEGIRYRKTTIPVVRRTR